jgi:hypothetical protein
MNKVFLFTLFIIILGSATVLSNQYFEDKIGPLNPKVLGLEKEQRFFLPFPKDNDLISWTNELRKTKIIISVKKPAQELKEFYQEILRSKDYEKDYEYEKDNFIELRFIKEQEDLKITISQSDDISLVEFNYHN